MRGERVTSKYDFSLVNYSLKHKTITLCFRYRDRKASSYMYETIPMYNSIVYIGLPGYDYMIPGPNAPEGHPDYFPYSKYSDKHKNVLVFFNNCDYYLILDPDFKFNGRYKLVPLNPELKTHNFTAKERTEDELAKYLAELKDTEFNGTDLNGVVVYEFDYKVLIQDPFTNVEYSLSKELLLISY